jgi:hypothetical protein
MGVEVIIEIESSQSDDKQYQQGFLPSDLTGPKTGGALV